MSRLGGRFRVIMGVLVFSGIAWVLAGCQNSQGAESGGPTTVKMSVSEVIEENLSTWRFKPGEEVFVNRSAHPVFQVALTAAPDGRVFLAWTTGRRQNTRVVVAGSPDGTNWATKITLAPGTKYIPAVAIAANSAGEIVVAWWQNLNCWAVHRSPSGQWGEPAVVGKPQPKIEKNIQGSSVALTTDADGGFWLLALVGPSRESPQPRLWKRQPGGRWVESSPPEFEPYHMHGSLGYREGLVSVARRHLVRLHTRNGWHAVTPLPWEPPPPVVSRTLSLWIRPTGPAAVLTWSPDLAHWSTHLVTSQDLKQWSEPLFLGGMTRPGCAAVAATERGIYAATTFEPWWWDRVEREGHQEVVWSSPRVFLLDDRLTQDTDGDGLTDITEEWLVTDYENPDTDADGIPDGADLDPLAASVPDTGEAQICQAVFDAVVPERMQNPWVVVAPERQVFADHQTRVLCLKRKEAEAYLAKYGWVATILEITDIQVGHHGQTATVKWRFWAGSGSLRDVGVGPYAANLEKRNGEWVITDRSHV